MAPPGVGGKRIIHNTRERVLSGDHNREQSVHDQMLAEILRCMTDASFELDVRAGSVEVFSTGSENPIRATVLAGIRPRPEVGTTNLFIEPGSLCIVDTPSPGPDDSKLAFVVDPGVQTAGALTLTPGSGGAIRIDVIECQRIEQVLEADNRDIFDPSTGLFSPALVNKVTAGRLAYRIRTGTPGLGFPGVEAGWLPLAVCSVPAGATTWDTVTLWDVRPMAHERVQQPFGAYPSLNYVHRHNVWSDITTVFGEVRVYGVCDVSFGAYRAGGQLIHPGTTNGYLNVADTTLWAPGFSSSLAPWYLYLVYPFGLPRWVQYSPASAGIREPRGLRGIPVMSRWTPRYDGRPGSFIAQTPAWTGLFDPPSQDAIVALAGLQGPSGGPFGVHGDGRTIQFVDEPTLEISQSASNGVTSTEWTFTDNVTHPGNARAVYVQFRIAVTVTAGAPGNITYGKSLFIGGPDNVADNFAVVALADYAFADRTYVEINGVYELYLFARLPLTIDQQYTSPRAFKALWTHTVGGPTLTVTDRKAIILGWELGP